MRTTRKIWQATLSILLILVMLVQIVPAQVWASVISIQESTSDPVTTVIEDVPVTVVGEEESLRTETEKHFRLSDGSFIAVSYGMPVHYQDASGNWEDIDNTLSLSADQSVYTAFNNEFATAFAANLSAGRVLASSYNGLSVSMSLLDQSQAQTMVANAVATLQTGMIMTYDRTVEAVIVSDADAQAASVMSLTNSSSDTTEGWTADDLIPETLSSSVLYEDVYPGVDLLYTAYGYDIKEQIIVNTKQSAYRYDFFLETVGLTAVLNADSSITMADSEGNVIYAIPAPYMTDNAGATSDAVSYTLTQVSGGYVLTVTADATWIDNDDRVFPVAIDPTIEENVTDESSIYYSYVKEGTPDESYTDQIKLGYGADTTVKEQRLFIHAATLPTIPGGCIVTEASIALYMTEYSAVSCQEIAVAAYGVTSDKSEEDTYQSWIEGMTWSTQATYATGNMIDYVVLKNGETGYKYWDLTELAKDWYTPGEDNHTFALTITPGASAYSASYWAEMTFGAYNTANPPIIIVSYRNHTGIEDYYTYATLGGGEAGIAYIADFSGQLKITKDLFSYASSTNPFTLRLVYNSDYFMYIAGIGHDPATVQTRNMKMGYGWTLNVLQRVEQVSLGGVIFLKYTDGDGTVHYFQDDPDDEEVVYYDEDGLGLQIERNTSGQYIMSDMVGNTYTFTAGITGFLTRIADEDGNQIIISQTAGRITQIQQKNNGCNAVTIATFAYNTAGNITTITDAAGIAYNLGYSGNKLISIWKDGTKIADYNYTFNRIARIKDVLSEYSIVFAYNDNGRVSHYHEVDGDGTVGANVDIVSDGYDRTTYQDYGNDRTKNTFDDIITHYLFDYAGRTANAYTTNKNGNVIGASNAVYTGTGTTDKRNNRILRTASIGVAAEQKTMDASFENMSYQGWNVSTGITRSSAIARTGTYSAKASLTRSITSTRISTTTPSLYLGGTYTLSAYVNTSAMPEGKSFSIYLEATDGVSVWRNRSMNYYTSGDVDDGWTRISLTFTPSEISQHTVSIVIAGSYGTIVYIDDFQLELADAPSNLNLLENGDFQTANYAWTFGSNGIYDNFEGLEYNFETNIAARITSSPQNASANISQTVTVNMPGTQTYVLSGWGKASAVPDNTDEENIAYEQDTLKTFGLRVILTYSDNTKEYFYSPFNTDITDWQYNSLSIIPGSPEKTVSTITVVCAYERNGNHAHFDNISLVRQTVQSMNYDTDGNLLSASTSGVAADQNTYDSEGNLDTTVTGTGSTIDYTYDDTIKHRLLSYTVDQVTTSFAYDTYGNVLTNSIQTSGSNMRFLSQSVYTNNGNLLASSTDVNGLSVSYTYRSDQNIMLGLPSAVTDTNGTTTSILYDNFGRTTNATIANTAEIAYTYTGGNLTTITRTTSTGTVSYNFTYDGFGNITSVKIGNTTLVTYTYASGNGALIRQTYANGDTITFTYDYLGRIKTETLSDGRVVTYTYNGEGQLFSVIEEGGDSPAEYYYTYDTLGRLVASEKRSTTGESLMRVHLSYDGAGQLICQTWNIGGTEFTESYTYDSDNGNLATMTTAGQTLQMNYDALQRLISVESDLYTKEYTYRNMASNQTTMQVTKVAYTDLPTAINFNYTYNLAGNIAVYTAPDGEQITYYYDPQGQLTRAAGDVIYTYTYDAAGNILTANGHTYTYNSVWKDMLWTYDGEAFTYDSSGNPTSYYNGTRWTFTWENGRSLATATDGTTSISYAYDAGGLRTSKTVGTVIHNYYYASGKLLRETYGSNVLDFFYDQNGYPYALKYNGTMYYYITNLQGDVMYLVDSSGATVASYEYDPFGNIISQNGSMATINPLRYRGYYYDADLDMYYLQSRYYDPNIGRFINADNISFLGTNDPVLSLNLFSYCENNPISNVDPLGLFSIPTWSISWAIDAAILALASYLQITWMSYMAPIKFLGKKAAVKFFTKNVAPLLAGMAKGIGKVLAQVVVWLGEKGMAATINATVNAGIAGILAEPYYAITMFTSFGGLIAGILDYATDGIFNGMVRFG